MVEQQLYSLIHENCVRFSPARNTLVKLCTALQLPKMEVSQALKSLQAAGQIITIQAKPALYLSRAFVLEQGVENPASSYPSLASLNEAMHPHAAANGKAEELDPFESLIGSSQSLKTCLNQVRATLSYPPEGLPLLLLGPTGTGKSLIARTAFEWCRKNGLLQKEGRFVTVNCSEFANNPELLTANLFGYVKGAFTGAEKDSPGLADAANGGILFLDEVHNLRYECQEKLFLLMDQGIFHRMGDNEHWQHSRCRIIFATTEDPQKVLLKTLLRRIPVLIHIPSLEERTRNERLELIWSLYHQEEQKLKRRILLSPAVFSHLMQGQIPGNIGGLKAAIQYSCISALYNSDPGGLIIRLSHLPAYFLNQPVLQRFLQDQEYISLDSLRREAGRQSIFIDLLETLYNIPQEDWMMQAAQELRRFLEKLNPGDSPRQHFFADGAAAAFETIQMSLEAGQAEKLGALLLEYDSSLDEIKAWSAGHQDLVLDCIEDFQQMHFRLSRNAAAVCEFLSLQFELEILPVLLELMTLLLYSPQKEKRLAGKACIILAHGRAAASSIAEAANQMLEEYVFDAIDMPLYVQPDEVAEKLSLYVKRLGRIDELYLLVDMGSLMDLPKSLDLPQTDIGILNNISTLAALALGNGVLQGMPMDSLIPYVARQSYFQYRIHKGKKLIPAILCSCLTGVGTAVKIQEILQQSIPEQTCLVFPVVPYEELLETGLLHPLLADKQVLGMVGTADPEIEGLAYTGIESLILQEADTPLFQVLNTLCPMEQMEEIQEALIRSFSLSNLMTELTILNPHKLLEKISASLDRLQKNLSLHLSHSACFGLYIHICCMVERLILNHMPEMETDLPMDHDFRRFRDQFLKDFAPAAAYYRISIPDSEIRIIYTYVQNDAPEQGEPEF